ncbi:MAG: cytochrome D1 [Candidatus Rokubacteria bacterium]|nr:cytochrome D1 [Candidatus Rokubacteria bacterium]
MRHHAVTRAARWAVLTFLLAFPAFARAPEGRAAAPEGATSPNRLAREGVTVEFSAKPAGGDGDLREGDYADVSFRITDTSTGRPVRSLAPGAWMDIGQPVAARDKAPLDCRQKMGLYLSGRVGIRPMIDLNSYYVLALNRDSSISVVDPHVGMAGKTYLYAHIALPKPGADWAKTTDDKRLFVTTPRGGQVVVVDAESFKVAGKVDVGGLPVRIVMQRDGRYLWVGDDSAEAARSGVVVIDGAALSVAGRIPTGRGHHEITLSPDDRWAFVSNREEGTVSVIDVQRLAKVKDVKTGLQPISLAYSRLSQALYVADGETGEIAVIDGQRQEVVARIAAKPGLGPMRFTEDGRWGFVVNTRHDTVHVLDISNNRLAHTVPVGKRPFQLAVTGAFAYVRSLDSEKVSMIPLSELGRDQMPRVTDFGAGTETPGAAGPGIAVAAPMVPALGEAAVMVGNPADGNIYFYMEGMVAPMATFRSYGHRPAALEVVNRSLKETEPGVYRTTVRLPAAGTYDVGFVLNSPQLVHCFAADVKVNPALARTGPSLEIAYLVKDRRVPVGQPVTVGFKLIDPDTQQPRTGLGDVGVYYVSSMRHRAQAPVRERGDGVYEATISVPEAGAYYVYVAVPSAKIQLGDLTHLSLIAERTPGATRRR